MRSDGGTVGSRAVAHPTMRGSSSPNASQRRTAQAYLDVQGRPGGGVPGMGVECVAQPERLRLEQDQAARMSK